MNGVRFASVISIVCVEIGRGRYSFIRSFVHSFSRAINALLFLHQPAPVSHHVNLAMSLRVASIPTMQR